MFLIHSWRLRSAESCWGPHRVAAAANPSRCPRRRRRPRRTRWLLPPRRPHQPLKRAPWVPRWAGASTPARARTSARDKEAAKASGGLLEDHGNSDGADACPVRRRASAGSFHCSASSLVGALAMSLTSSGTLVVMPAAVHFDGHVG